jgi:NitT/TauT family transport system substrate-binding protein
MGSGLQYILSQIAEKSGFDLKTVKLLPLQSNANVASAIAGGRADSGAVNSSGALPLLEKGDAKLLGWTGDLTGVDQAYLVFASAKMADEHGGTVRHLLAAYRNASRDYYAAFTDAKGMRADGPTATATLAIIAKYLGQPPDVAERGLPYFDAEGRIDVDDVQRQIDWYRAQGFIRGDVTAEAIVDDRYIVRRHGQSDAR